MTFAEFVTVTRLQRRLWPTSNSGSQPDPADLAAAAAVNFPLWADLDLDDAVAALYALKGAGQRWSPTVDEVRRQLAPQELQGRGWPWWHQQFNAAIDAWRSEPPGEVTYVECDDGVEVIAPPVRWTGQVPAEVLEVIDQFGGMPWFASKWPEGLFRRDVQQLVAVHDEPVGAVSMEAGREMAQLMEVTAQALPEGVRKGLPSLASGPGRAALGGGS